MNKQYIIGLVLASCLLANCKKDSIEVYNAGHYVQFTNVATDTVLFSFFFYPGKNEVDVAMPVKLVGKMPEQDLHYKMQTGDGTDAPAGNFSIPAEFTFKKGQAMDTAHIIIKNSADLTTKTFTLNVQIAPDGDVQPGQSNYSRRIFKINNMVTKPAWWVGNVETIYLGKYSEKKYRTFMLATNVGDITPYSLAEQRDLYIKFKYYLIGMKDAGTPVLEDDGSDMLTTVPLIG